VILIVQEFILAAFKHSKLQV